MDMLLADVRSGFCNRRYEEGSFSVTKVHTVQLDSVSAAAVLGGEDSAAAAVVGGGGTPDGALKAATASEASDIAAFVRGGQGRVSLRKKKQDNRSASCSDSPCEGQGSDALSHKRNRKSYPTEDDASLIEFLMDTEMEVDKARPEQAFDRYASLRRRRQERRDRRNLLGVVEVGRERAPSPVIQSDGKMYTPPAPGQETARTRPTSDSEGLDTPSRPLRRTRSWLDRPSLDKAVAAAAAAEDSTASATATPSSGVKTTSKDKDTDALVARIKSRLRGDKDHRDPRTTPPIPEETPLPPSSATPVSATSRPLSAPNLRGEDTARGPGDSSRWRASADRHLMRTISERDKAKTDGVKTAGTVTSDTATPPGQSIPSTLPPPSASVDTTDSPPISTMSRTDTQPGSNAATTPSASTSLEKSRQQLKKRYSSVDPSSVHRLLNGHDGAEKAASSQDDMDLAVSVSMRKAMSDKNGINLDGLLKTIENSERPIDTFGVISPCQRQNQPQSTVARVTAETSRTGVVARVNAETSRPETPGGEPPELKQKREKRKKRSTLVLDDVHAALRDISSSAGQTDSGQPAPQDSTSTPTSGRHQGSASQPNQPHSLTNGDHSGEAGKARTHREDKAAAKQAAKKNFRDARFGYKDMKSVAEMTTTRCRSDVDRQDVDQALKDLVAKGNMSRSKSYDESVARQAVSEPDQTLNDNGHTPTMAEVKSTLLRGNSNSRLSTDGRRHGLYIPSDDSDTEVKVEGKGGSRRPSSAKSDSPKSVSRLSLKSTNTSTETLQADKDSEGEASPQQSRPTQGREQPELLSVPPRPASTTALEMERPARRSYSHLDRRAVEQAVSRLQTKVEQLEDDDNPLASVAKWRLKRTKRLSVYDNVSDSDNGSPSPRNRSLMLEPPSGSQLLLQRAEVLEYKNEVGSRSSYASSTDTDQGFESMGTVSQRTSLSSTLESEVPAAGQPRKAEGVHTGKRDSGLGDTGGSTAVVVTPDLSEEDSRKQRTQTWTEEAVRVTAGQDGAVTSDPKALSPDSGHSTSREDLWSEGGSPVHSTAAHSNSPHSKVPPSPSSHKKGPAPPPPSQSGDNPPTVRSATPNEASRGKPRPLPSYMRSTNSSARARAAPPPSPAPSDPDISFQRGATSRKSFRGKDSGLKRDSAVRASMRAESAYRREGTTRPPVHHSRAAVSSPAPSRGLQPPASRARSDSNASVVSSVSTTSDVSCASTSKGASSRRLTSGSGQGSRPTTPSLHAPPRAGTPSGGLGRTQSMRITSSRASQGGSRSERTSTPLSHERRSATPLSHEAKQASTPDVSASSSRRRSHLTAAAASTSHDAPSRSQTPTPTSTPTPTAPPRSRSRFMEPTASSRAAATPSPAPTSSPTPPPRTRSGPAVHSLTRHGSLRAPRTSPRLTSSELSHAGSAAKNAGASPGKPLLDPHLLQPVSEQGGDLHHLQQEAGGGGEVKRSAGQGKDRGAAPAKKTVIVSSAQARAGQDRKK